MVPKLQEVHVSGKPSRNSVAKLRDMESVSIEASEFAYDTAIAVGERVKELRLCNNALSVDHIVELEMCSGLKELTMIVGEGADQVIPGLVEKLPKLRKLEVQWARPEPCRHVGDGNFGFHACYCTAESGAILKAVRAAPALESVEVSNLRVPLAEMKGLLDVLGSRLKSLNLSLEGQDELPLERLHEGLRSARKTNPSLRDIEVTDNHRSFFTVPVGTREEREKIRQELFDGLLSLKDRAPYVDVDALDYIVDMYTAGDESDDERDDENVDGFEDSDGELGDGNDDMDGSDEASGDDDEGLGSETDDMGADE